MPLYLQTSLYLPRCPGSKQLLCRPSLIAMHCRSRNHSLSYSPVLLSSQMQWVRVFQMVCGLLTLVLVCLSLEINHSSLILFTPLMALLLSLVTVWFSVHRVVGPLCYVVTSYELPLHWPMFFTSLTVLSIYCQSMQLPTPTIAQSPLTRPVVLQCRPPLFLPSFQWWCI